MSSTLQHIKQSFHLATPMVLSQMTRMLMAIIGVVMVSHLGVVELAASGLASSYFLVIGLFGYGAVFSITVFIGHAFGSKDKEALENNFINAFWFAFFLSIPIALLMLFAPWILLCLGQKPVVVAHASGFLYLSFITALVSFQNAAFQQIYISLHHAKINYVLSTIALIVATLVFYPVILGHWGCPRLGVTGIAVGYIAANIVVMIVSIFYVQTIKELKHISFNKVFHFDFSLIKKMFQMGWPVGMAMMLELGATMVVVLFLGYLGHIPLASYQIVWQMVLFSVMIPVGFSQAVSAIISKFQGAKQHDAVRAAGIINILLSFTCTLILALIYVSFSDFFIHLFLHRNEVDEAQVYALAKHMLYISAFAMAFDALRLTSVGALRGMRDVKMPLVMSIVGYWIIGVPLASLLGFGFHLGALGLWAGIAIGTIILGPSMFIRFLIKS